ncbi:MAG: Alkaline phosphatase [Herbaspirillum frisingense]|uniref:Alkaline phosphatase n=1 Tax=Herbaspirillum frisingense TaxID=92645 RepID=A0A7V8FZG8_9BURK|nr:MAG: Alkaline phosphatase [Herbaspirillum frisingense]
MNMTATDLSNGRGKAIRRWLAGLAAAGSATLAVIAAAEPPPTLASQPPRNVIFFLGDGMGPVTVTAACIHGHGEAGRLAMETLAQTARIKTFSLDAQTTDSAPSMAAYMTGVKMRNDVISMSSDTHAFDAQLQPYQRNADATCPPGNGQAVPTLLEMSKQAGKAVGVVTTTRVSHATPAATYAHVCNRDAYNTISEQATPGAPGYNPALKDGIDVLMGGGLRHFLPKADPLSKRNDQLDLLGQLRAAGYHYVASGTALRKFDPAVGGKLLGLFALSDMDFELDRVKKKLDQPSLAEMTAKAIGVLRHKPQGYFLMVEGGRIDHALHGTNAKRALEDTLAFDAAVRTALELVDLSDTLIVVTADHDHAIAFNGYPRRGNPVLGKVVDYREGKLALAADGKPYTTLVFGNGSAPRRAEEPDLSAVDTEADDYLQQVGVRFAGAPGAETHGGGDVMLFAAGAGSAGFKGTMENVKVFGKIKYALGF